MNQSKRAYAIVVERTRTGFSCYAPDLPGCVASAKTKRQLEKLMAEANRTAHRESEGTWESHPSAQLGGRVY
jgi:predicted RNase H-like HicB family nuclease